MRARVIYVVQFPGIAYLNGSLSLTIRWRSFARYRGVVLNGWRRLDQDGMTIYTSKNK